MDKPVKVSERFILMFTQSVFINPVTCYCGKTHFAVKDSDVVEFFSYPSGDSKVVIGCKCETDVRVENFLKYYEPQIAAYLDLSSKREIPQHHGDIDEHHEQGHS